MGQPDVKETHIQCQPQIHKLTLSLSINQGLFGEAPPNQNCDNAFIDKLALPNYIKYIVIYCNHIDIWYTIAITICHCQII
jgi:hypothetical protein